jgi:hypothetical protein
MYMHVVLCQLGLQECSICVRLILRLCITLSLSLIPSLSPSFSLSLSLPFIHTHQNQTKTVIHIVYTHTHTHTHTHSHTHSHTHTHIQGRVELVCDVPLSRVNTSLHSSIGIPVQLPEHNLAKFMDHPPDHAYLPPIPNHTPKLMCQEALGRAIKKGSALVSVDSLLPYQVCVSYM